MSQHLLLKLSSLQWDFITVCAFMSDIWTTNAFTRECPNHVSYWVSSWQKADFGLTKASGSEPGCPPSKIYHCSKYQGAHFYRKKYVNPRDFDYEGHTLRLNPQFLARWTKGDCLFNQIATRVTACHNPAFPHSPA